MSWYADGKMEINCNWKNLANFFFQVYRLVALKLEILFFSFFLDIDECATNNYNCDANAFCNNTIGSYNCTCNPGYTGNGQNCTGEYSFRYFQSPTKVYV